MKSLCVKILLMMIFIQMPAFISAEGDQLGTWPVSVDGEHLTRTEEYQFKSPSNVFLFSLKDLFIPFVFYAGGGMDYAKSAGEAGRFSDVPGTASLIGDGLFFAGVMASFVSPEMHQYTLQLLSPGLIMWSAAFVSDMAYYGQSAGLYSTSNFMDTIRKKESELSTVKLDYRDPFLAASMSMLVPGGGFFYQGRYIKGLIWLGVETAVCAAAWMVADDKLQPGEAHPFVYLLAARYAFLIPEMCTAMMDTDEVNEAYFKQLFAKNSPYRIKRDPENTRSPLLAFLIATAGIPGLGNMYAGNMEGGKGLLGITVFGGLLSLSSGLIGDLAHSWNMKPVLFNMGIVIMAIAKAADMATAPAAADMHNIIYAGWKFEKHSGMIVSPVIIGSTLGLGASYNF